MPKTLSTTDLQAAVMVAEGRTELDIYTACGKNRSWIQALKRREDFQEAVARSKNKLVEIIQETTEKHYTTQIDEHHQKIENFRQKSEDLGNRFLNIVEKALNLYEAKIQQAQAEDISLHRIASDLKSLSTLSESGRSLLAQSLGIEHLMQTLNLDEDEK